MYEILFSSMMDQDQELRSQALYMRSNVIFIFGGGKDEGIPIFNV